jgi:hypothetical protein
MSVSQVPYVISKDHSCSITAKLGMGTFPRKAFKGGVMAETLGRISCRQYKVPERTGSQSDYGV